MKTTTVADVTCQSTAEASLAARIGESGEVCRFFGITPRTLDRWLADRVIGCSRPRGRRIFSGHDVAKCAARNARLARGGTDPRAVYVQELARWATMIDAGRESVRHGAVAMGAGSGAAADAVGPILAELRDLVVRLEAALGARATAGATATATEVAA